MSKLGTNKFELVEVIPQSKEGSGDMATTPEALFVAPFLVSATGSEILEGPAPEKPSQGDEVLGEQENQQHYLLPLATTEDEYNTTNDFSIQE